MADDKPSTKQDAPPPPAKDSEREDMIPKKRYDELLSRFESMESTLKALKDDRSAPARAAAPAPAAVAGVFADLAKTIQEELGVDASEVPVIKNVLRITDTYATRFAQERLLPVLGQLAERLDVVEARSAFPDYNDFSDEIESERTRRASQGQYASRSELYHVVRGRNVDKLVERARTSDTPVGVTAGDGFTDAGVAKTGPSQGQRSVDTPAELDALTPEERKARVDELTF